MEQVEKKGREKITKRKKQRDRKSHAKVRKGEIRNIEKFTGRKKIEKKLNG